MQEFLSSIVTGDVSPLLANALAFAVFGCIQTVLTCAVIWSLRTNVRERREISKELFGLVRRIEGLTAERRAHVLRHYDQMLGDLSRRLPPAVAAELSDIIFDVESKVLTHLASLEPTLAPEDRAKFDDLIRSMENLERSIVGLTADTVARVMKEGRRTLTKDEAFNDLSCAA